MSAALLPTVFISYSHDTPEHAQRVLALADELRKNGIDARIDQYVDDPPEGWLRWMERQLVECRFVLLVCTPTYRTRFDRTDPGDAGRGVSYEGLIAEQLLYEAQMRNEKLIPVLFEDGDEKDVPLVLRAYTRYRLMRDYERLYRRLTDQHATKAPPLGELRVLPPAPRPALGESGLPPTSASPRTRETRGTMNGDAITEQRIVDALAEAFADEGMAREVVKRAGFPPAQTPVFRVPLVFWSKVVTDARNGVIRGGVRAIVEEAVELAPHNGVLQRYLAG